MNYGRSERAPVEEPYTSLRRELAEEHTYILHGAAILPENFKYQRPQSMQEAHEELDSIVEYLKNLINRPIKNN
ncbi:MAG TPA: hypothetical protein VJK03_05005 [Candidatus Nanoarchaeia archaeon]|nr:hypothetical protein [Candidatus Nanoarchaeia archaeon]